MSEKDILIYTTSTCPFCTGAKSWLAERGLQYREVSLDDAEARTKFLAENANLRTVPQIFVDGEHLGGFQELQQSNLA